MESPLLEAQPVPVPEGQDQALSGSGDGPTIDGDVPVSPSQIKVRYSRPPRPARPGPAFSGYFKDYVVQKRESGENLLMKTAMSQAWIQWKDLAGEEKNKYEVNARQRWDKYSQDLKAWKAEVTEYKRPAPPFGIFVKEVWQEEQKLRAEGQPARAFKEVHQQALDIWNHGEYKRRCQEAYKEYKAKLSRFSEEKLKEFGRSQEQDGVKEIYTNPFIQLGARCDSKTSVVDMDYHAEDTDGSGILLTAPSNVDSAENANGDEADNTDMATAEDSASMDLDADDSLEENTATEE